MAGDFPNLSSATIARWPEPNVIDPSSRDWFPAYSITLTAVATIVLSARMWTQFKNSSLGLGIDDYLAAMAWVLAMLFTASCVLGTLKYGFDKHIWDVPPFLHRRAALIEWLAEGSFILSTSLTKMSVLCFYRRLEIPCTVALKRIVYGLIALTACYSLGCLTTQTLLCKPTSAYWRVGNSSQCASQEKFYLVQGSLDVLSTLYSITTPALVLRNHPLTKSQRTGLQIVYMIALSVLGAGAARTVFLYRLVRSTNGDATWNGFNVFVWSQLESQLGISCASLPFILRLLPQYPTLPIVFYADARDRKDSLISRMGSSLSGQIKRLPIGGNGSVRQDGSIDRPHAEVIAEWEFQALESPRHATSSPSDEISYDRYVLGQFGPPAPPKDSRRIFDQYRREHHGDIV